MFGLWIDHTSTRSKTVQFNDSSGIDDDTDLDQTSSENEDIPNETKLKSFYTVKPFSEKTPLKTRIKTGRYRRIRPLAVSDEYKGNNPLLWPFAITYLSCCIVQHPIYVSDLMRWMYTRELLPIGSPNVLPAELRKYLTDDANIAQTFAHFDSKLPDSHIYVQVAYMGKVFRTKYQYQIPNLSMKPLLTKLIYMLYLPPEIYPAVLRYIELFQIDFDLTKNDSSTKVALDDRALYCLVILVCKLMYGFDNIIRHPQATEQGAQIIDWELWLSMIYRTWIETDSFGYMDPTNVLYWNTERLSRCLDWAEDHLYDFENSLLSTARGTREAATRYMRKTFPVRKRDPKPYDSSESILFTKQRSKKRARSTISGSQSLENTQEDNDEYDGDEEVDSDEELKLNGVLRKERPKAGEILSRDLYSESNPNIYRPDKDDSDDSAVYDDFVKDSSGNVFRVGEEDLQVPIEDDNHAQRIVQPADHILLEVNQLLNSTTAPYEIQLTKFVKDTNPASDWEDVDSEQDSEYEERVRQAPEGTTDIDERYGDALMYPGDLERGRPAELDDALNGFWGHLGRTRDPSFYQRTRSFKEHNYDAAPVEPRESAVMDLKNTRYKGRLLRPGHRYVVHGMTDTQDAELVTALFEAAPGVIGVSAKSIRELFIKVESFTMLKRGRNL